MTPGKYVLPIIFMICTALLFISCPGAEDDMEKFVYVANQYTHSVTIIDIDQLFSDLEHPENAVLTTIALPSSGGEGIRGIAVSPDKSSVFIPVSSSSGNDLYIISFISADEYSISDPIPTGVKPVAVEITPDGKYAYVANNGDNTVSVVSTETRSVISTITVGNAPQNIAISPDGQFAYVTNKSDLTVSVIDTDRAVNSPVSAIVSTIVITPNQPKGIAVTPDGQYAFVATAGGEGSGNQVAVLDLKRKKEVDTDGDLSNGITPIILYESTAGAPRVVAIAPDGKYAYVTNLYTNVDSGMNDTVSVIDTTTYEVVEDIIVGNGPKGIDITSNGRYAFIANSWLFDFSELIHYSVSVIDTDTRKVICTIAHEDLNVPTWLAM